MSDFVPPQQQTAPDQVRSPIQRWPTGSITLNVWRIKLSQEGSPLVIWINLGRCLGWLNQPEQPIRDPLGTIGDLVHGCVAQPITEVSGYDSIPTKHGVVIPDTFQP